MMRSDMPQEGLDAIFGQYDTDKDGKVSFEEWKQARQWFWVRIHSSEMVN